MAVCQCGVFWPSAHVQSELAQPRQLRAYCRERSERERESNELSMDHNKGWAGGKINQKMESVMAQAILVFASLSV